MPGWLIASVISVFALVAVGLFVTLVRVLIGAASSVRVRAAATVVRHVRRVATETGDSDTWAAVYRFIAEGRTHEVEDRWSSVPARFKVGEHVTVEYPAGEPQHAAPPRRAIMVLGTLLSGIAALVFAIVAAFAWVMALA
jgi:hypothetical protein